MGEPRWLSVRCHDWKGSALDQGQGVADWLSSFLGQRVRLVKYGGMLADTLAGGSMLSLLALMVTALSHHPGVNLPADKACHQGLMHTA